MASTLDRLRGRVVDAIDPREHFLARARLAAHLAQIGEVNEAKSIAADLRRVNVASPNGLDGIQLVLLDGISSYYNDLDGACLDRISRALALAQSINSRRLIGESAVWLALVGYTFDKVNVLESALLAAVEHVDAIETSLHAKLCAVIADLLQLAGLMSEAGEWYSKARRLARVDNNDAVLVAIEFNRLAAGLTRLKYDEIIEDNSAQSESRTWALEFESVDALHRVYQNKSLSNLLILCNARRRYVSRDYNGTVPLLESLLADEAWGSVGLAEQTLRLELLWCKLLRGDMSAIESYDFPSVEELATLNHGNRLDCVYYLSRICRCVAIAIDKDALESSLNGARSQLIAEIEVYRLLASKIVRRYSELNLG